MQRRRHLGMGGRVRAICAVFRICAFYRDSGRPHHILGEAYKTAIPLSYSMIPKNPRGAKYFIGA